RAARRRPGVLVNEDARKARNALSAGILLGLVYVLLLCGLTTLDLARTWRETPTAPVVEKFTPPASPTPQVARASRSRRTTPPAALPLRDGWDRLAGRASGERDIPARARLRSTHRP